MALQRREFIGRAALVGGIGVEPPDALVKFVTGVGSLVNVSLEYQEYVTPADPLIGFLATRARLSGARVKLPGHPEFEYVRDPTQFVTPERWQKPRQYVRNGYRGDCDDYALFVASLVEAAGHDARVVVGLLGDRGHALTEFKRGDDYVVTSVGAPKTIWHRQQFDQLERWQPVAMFGPDQPMRAYDPDW